LADIDPKVAGASVQELRDAQNSNHFLYERVENLTLPVTVLRCDFSSQLHMEYLFKIFHRLNAGGIRLTNQEIRNCIYSGSFNDLIIELDDNENWIQFKKAVSGRKDRFRSVELILRFFAFHDDVKSYHGNLTKFLNAFMLRHRHDDAKAIKKYEKLFVGTIEVLVEKLLPHIDKIGFSQAEALLVAVSKNLKALRLDTDRAGAAKIKKFHKIELLQTAALSADLSRTESVRTRIAEAIDALS
jgi:hypothetical protein